MTERISYASEDGELVGRMPISLVDRVFGALLAFFGVALTLAIAPVLLFGGFPKIAAFQHPIFFWEVWGLFLWGGLWLGPALIVGWVAGFPKVLALFSHVWLTADPPNRRRSLGLWCAILIVCASTAIAMSHFARF